MAKGTDYEGVRRTASGKIKIYFRHGPRPGKPYSWVLETHVAASLADASRIRELRKTRVQMGLPAVEPDAVNPKIADAATDWAKFMIAGLSEPVPPLSRRTVNSYIGGLETHWLPWIGGLPIRSLRFAHLRDIDSTSGKWVSQKTRANARNSLRRFLDWCLRGDLIEHNPAIKFDKLKITREQTDAYSPAEREQIVSWLHENAPVRPALYFHIGFDTGMRSGEIIALDWEHFDGDGFEVEHSSDQGQQKDTKTGKARYVPISDDLKRRLVAHRQDQLALGQHNGRVMLNIHGAPYRRFDKLNTWFHKAVKALGLPDLLGQHKPYPWRKAFVTELYGTDMHPQDAADMAGHSRTMAEKHYVARTNKERLKKARKENLK